MSERPPQLSLTWQPSGFPIKSLEFWHNCGRFPGLDHQAVSSRGSSGGHSFPTLHLNTAYFCGSSGLKRDTRQQKSTFVAKRIIFHRRTGQGPQCGTLVVFHMRLWDVRHNLPTDARKQRPQTLQNIALNKALMGFTQALPVRQLLSKKKDKVWSSSFHTFKHKKWTKLWVNVDKSCREMTKCNVFIHSSAVSIFVHNCKCFTGPLKMVLSVWLIHLTYT